MAVRGPVVEDRQHIELGILERERPEDLVRAGRVLDEQDRQLPLADVNCLCAPERGRDSLEPGDDLREWDLERKAQRGSADRVVDVVEAG